MKKNYVAMGEYYRDGHGLVRTVCSAMDVRTGETMIVYVEVDDNGFASDALLMTEFDFKEAFNIAQ